MSIPPNYPPPGGAPQGGYPSPQGYPPPPQGYPPPQGGYPYPPPPPRKASALPWILGLGCGVPLLFFFGCIAVGGKIASSPEFQKEFKEAYRKAQQEAASGNAQGKVEYDPSTFQSNASTFGQEVTGAIRNKSSETIPYLEIRFAVLDSSGEQIGTTFTNTTNLAPGDTWNFKASITTPGAAKWKLLSVGTKVGGNSSQ